MEKFHYQQSKKLVEKAALLKKFNNRVEEKIKHSIERYFKQLEKDPKFELEHEFEKVSELLSLNWKLNKNFFFIKSQLKYHAQKLKEGEEVRA